MAYFLLGRLVVLLTVVFLILVLLEALIVFLFTDLAVEFLTVDLFLGALFVGRFTDVRTAPLLIRDLALGVIVALFFLLHAGHRSCKFDGLSVPRFDRGII
jgi:hypothetical protein